MPAGMFSTKIATLKDIFLARIFTEKHHQVSVDHYTFPEADGILELDRFHARNSPELSECHQIASGPRVNVRGRYPTKSHCAQ